MEHIETSDQLEDLDQFVARTKSLRQYEKYWVMAKSIGVIQVRMEDSNPRTINRYVKAIKKEKLIDRNDRYSGILRFSWVGRILTVRFIEMNRSRR